MRLFGALSIVAIAIVAGCIDPFPLKYGNGALGDVVIDGFISDQPGPYYVKLTRTFDVQSIRSFREDISASRITLYDNHGYEEILREVKQGLYKTDSIGLRGKIGDVYRLKVELRDGKIYESKPDTLSPSGKIDSIYFNYRESQGEVNSIKGFDIFFDANKGNADHDRFLWKFIGTYKVDTNPELYDTICADGRCPKPLRCSGYVLSETNQLEKVRQCACCTCWINLYNDKPILSEANTAKGGYEKVQAYYLPITQWTFMYHVNVKIQQFSFSKQAFQFWKRVKQQKEATESLFQPATGILPSYFTQVSGEPAPVFGLFYTASVSSKDIDITNFDFPPRFVLPPVDPIINNSCLKSFAFSTINRPAFWFD